MVSSNLQQHSKNVKPQTQKTWCSVLALKFTKMHIRACGIYKFSPGLYPGLPLKGMWWMGCDSISYALRCLVNVDYPSHLLNDGKGRQGNEKGRKGYRKGEEGA